MHQKRVILAAAAMCAALSVACGPQSAASPLSPAPSPTTAGCIVDAGPSSIDGVFNELPGYTVEPICPTDMDPYFGRSAVAEQYFEAAAGRVTENGYPVLTYMAAHLDSGTGESFVTAYIDAWWNESDLPKPVAEYTEQLGGREVTNFNIPAGPHGYIYASGPTVIIAYVDLDAAPATAEDAFTKILAYLG
jgi:hypothetical protein